MAPSTSPAGAASHAVVSRMREVIAQNPITARLYGRMVEAEHFGIVRSEMTLEEIRAANVMARDGIFERSKTMDGKAAYYLCDELRMALYHARFPEQAQDVVAAEQPHGTPEAVRSAYARAYERAAAAKLVAYKNDDRSYDVPSVSTPGDVHTVTIIGRRWYDLRCTCKGANHVACTHRAVVVHAVKYHVHAIRPVRQSAAYREAMADLCAGRSVWG